MTIYEINQAMYHDSPALTDALLEACANTIETYLNEHPSKYYVLLCKELDYYTFFTYKGIPNTKNFTKELISLLKDLGEVKDICFDQYGTMVENWITKGEETHAFMLIECKDWTIEV